MGKAPKEIRDRRLRALGVAIANRRKTLGLSQRGLAEEIEVTYNTVWEWEHGKIPIGAANVWDLADALETTPAELFSTADEVDFDLEDD